MRILDVTRNSALSSILLLLTENEARELKDSIEDMLERMDFESHDHIDDEDYQHELTVSLYDAKKISCFQERIQALIMDNR